MARIRREDKNKELKMKTEKTPNSALSLDIFKHRFLINFFKLYSSVVNIHEKMLCVY